MNIYPIEAATQSFKNRFEEFNHAEIHAHDIFKGQNEFSSLTLARKYEILGHLYTMIDTLPITVISVGIDKAELIANIQNGKYSRQLGPSLPSVSINTLLIMI